MSHRLPLRHHLRMDLDPGADAADPNCPRCLERMQLVVGAWWCPDCRTVTRPA